MIIQQIHPPAVVLKELVAYYQGVRVDFIPMVMAVGGEEVKDKRGSDIEGNQHFLRIH